jgi:hypothetical protein
MSAKSIDKVRQLEELILKTPQVEIPVEHILHAGVYARTVMVPAGVVITGALIKIPTLLVISGKTKVYIGDEVIEMNGQHVIPASSGRKQAFVAIEDTSITMIFQTHAKTVQEAEKEFTDEFDRLTSNRSETINLINITEY